MLRSADTAMYRAKALGKGRAERFAPQMRSEDLRRIELEVELRRAVEEDLLEVHYQPVVNLAHGARSPASRRWRGGRTPRSAASTRRCSCPWPRRLGPDPRARAAGARAGARRRPGRSPRRTGSPVTMCVNLSADQVTDPELLARCGRLCADFPDVQIVLELTEGTLIDDDGATVGALHELKAAGARACRRRLRRRLLLGRVPAPAARSTSSRSTSLSCTSSATRARTPSSRASCRWPRSMQLTVVVEGVETWADAVTIRDLGCGLAQGYLFCRPVPAEEMMQLAVTGSVDIEPLLSTPGVRRRRKVLPTS